MSTKMLVRRDYRSGTCFDGVAVLCPVAKGEREVGLVDARVRLERPPGGVYTRRSFVEPCDGGKLSMTPNQLKKPTGDAPGVLRYGCGILGIGVALVSLFFVVAAF